MKVEFILVEGNGTSIQRVVVEGDNLKACEEKALDQRPHRQIKFGRILDQIFQTKDAFFQIASAGVKK